MTSIRKIAENINMSKSFRGILSFNEPMSAHTTFKVGGNADVFAIPADEDSLLFLLRSLRAQTIPYFLLGGGSNLVVSDDGIEGFVIATTALDTIKRIENNTCNSVHNDDLQILFCGAGCTFEQITDFCVQNGLSGLESFAGLPGTVGGAVYMNARCYEKSISDVLYSACYITATDCNKVHTYKMDTADWDYKKSPFQSVSGCADTKKTTQFSCTGGIITSACFRVQKSDCHVIEKSCQKYIENRKEKGHFYYPSAGSVFKNNHSFGKPSGKIIDEVGLCGFRIGNAQIATWHGNFIINLGDASARDIHALLCHVILEVKLKTGFDLECEIIFCGKSY